MGGEPETDATGVPWLLSPEWAPGKPTGRGKRLTMPPKESLAEIQYLFSELYHNFCDSLPLKSEGAEPLADQAYVETRRYMMKLQVLRDELDALKVLKEDEKAKQELATTIRGAILRVEGYVQQKKTLVLSHEEHSRIYWHAQDEDRARKAGRTQGCFIA